MLPSFFNRTVIVIRPGTIPQRGTTIPDWKHATETQVTGCSVQTPTTSMEMDGRLATTLAGTVYLPPGTDVQAGDAIEYNGHRFLVVGEPMAWESPTGALDHVQVRIADWEG